MALHAGLVGAGSTDKPAAQKYFARGWGRQKTKGANLINVLTPGRRKYTFSPGFDIWHLGIFPGFGAWTLSTGGGRFHWCLLGKMSEIKSEAYESSLYYPHYIPYECTC